MGERQPVSIAFQVILCFIPLVWLWGFFRIEKLIAGIVMVIIVAILAFALTIFIPFFGYAIAWLASVFVPIYYIVKWSQEWNESILIEREDEEEDERDTNEESDDTETRYRLD